MQSGSRSVWRSGPGERGEGRHGGLVRVDRQHAGCGRAAAVAAQPAKVWVASFQLAVSVTSDPSRCVVVPVGSTLPPAPAVTVRVWVRSGVQRRRRPTGGRVLRRLRCREAGWAPATAQERRRQGGEEHERRGDGCVARSHQGFLTAAVPDCGACDCCSWRRDRAAAPGREQHDHEEAHDGGSEHRRERHFRGRGLVTMRVAATYPPEEAAETHRRMKAGGTGVGA